jgi:hypothetical protein
MDARLLRCAVLVAAFGSLGASYRTKNFIVSAPTPEMARQIGDAAETFRCDLAKLWLGREMPNWAQPCPITAQVGDSLGAGGATSFVFDRGEVFGWRMTIQGSLARILDSVLPHEVTHTVFATHFRQPLPRWADEGACTTVEHASERAKQQHMLIDFLRTKRGIAFNQMFSMKEYPHDVLPLYSQGYSVARYLIGHGGRGKFLNFIADGLTDENWTRATQKHYGVESLAALQNRWLDWVRKGSPALDAAQGEPAMVAVNAPRPSDRSGAVEAVAATRAAAPANRSADPPRRSSLDPDAPSIYERAAASPEAFAAATTPGASDRWTAPRGAAPLTPGEREVPAARAAAAHQAPQHQVTRPQPIERPRQVILEWSRPHGSPDPQDRAARAGGYPAARFN